MVSPKRWCNGGIGNIDDCLDSDIIFTALPTLYDDTSKSYDNSPTIEILTELTIKKYSFGIINSN